MGLCILSRSAPASEWVTVRPPYRPVPARTKKLTNFALSLLVRRDSFSEFYQFFRHPFADAFIGRSADAFRTIVPVIAGTFTAARLLVILGLLQREYDPEPNVVPVFLLNAAQDQRQTGRPILLGGPRILLRNRQVVSRRQRPA